MFQSVTVGQRAPEDAFRSPRSVSVLKQRTLEERRPRTTPEALMEVPGVFVQKTNHAGGAPIIRGAVGPQVLILIDGVRINTSIYRSGPNQYLNLLNAWSIKRFEILRGAGSLAYGSYAFGGVLNVVTQSPSLSLDREFLGEARLIGRYSSADQERSGHLSLAGSLFGAAVRASVTYGAFADLRPGATSLRNNGRLLSIDGKPVMASTNPFGYLTQSPEDGGQAFSGYQNLFVDTKLKWRIRSGWTLTAFYQRSMLIDSGRADQLSNAGSMRIYNNTLDFAYLRLKARLPAARTFLRATVSFQRQSESTYRRRFDTDKDFALSRENKNFDTVNVVGVMLDGETRIFPWWRLTYGADLYYDLVESNAESRRLPSNFAASTPNFPKGVNYMTMGAFATARFHLWRWGRSRGLYLHIGDRVNGFIANANARESFDAVNFVQFGNALFGSLQFLINRALNVSITYSEGFRAPNLQESTFIGDAGNDFEIPNPNLRPEISRTIEMTIRGSVRNRFYGWITGYTSFWSDLIDKENAEYKGQSTIDGKPVVRRTNFGDARVIGIEAGLGGRLWRRLRLQASATWTHGRKLETNGTETPLSRIPPFFGRVSARYDFGRRAFLEFFVLFADSQTAISSRDRSDPRVPTREEDPSRTIDGTPGWFTLNLRGGFRIHRHVRGILSVENLLNTLYKYHTSGVYGPGLNARIALEFTL